MRIALTGANGFTGRFVIEALAARGIEAIPLSVDLTNKDAVEAAVADTAFDRLIHLAARAFVNAADWEAFYTVNQLGTFYLLDVVARVRPGARCVVSSSAQVYGPGAEGLIAEDADTNPANHYAVSKLAMEQGARLWRNQLEVVVTRPFNYTGVGQGVEYLVSKIVDHFRRGADTIELGNLFVQRDFGDVRSVADAYVGLALAEAPPALVNICTGTVQSIGMIIDMLTAISGHSIDVRINPAFVRANDVAILGGDASRLRATLPDWQPRELQKTLAWMYEAGTASDS
jgi:nucleoside-diphosphate-sugar epimerase